MNRFLDLFFARNPQVKISLLVGDRVLFFFLAARSYFLEGFENKDRLAGKIKKE